MCPYTRQNMCNCLFLSGLLQKPNLGLKTFFLALGWAFPKNMGTHIILVDMFSEEIVATNEILRYYVNICAILLIGPKFWQNSGHILK